VALVFPLKSNIGLLLAAQHTVWVLIGGNTKLLYEVCSARLDVEDSRLFSQLSELKVSSVGPVGRQEVEPVNIRRAARVVSVSQVQPVHVRLGKRQRRRQRDSLQQQLAVARRLRDDVAQVGGGRVGVGEPQLVGGDGFRGAVLQPEARVVVEGRRDAVAVLDGEVEGAAAGRVAIGDDETVKAIDSLVRSRSEMFINPSLSVDIPANLSPSGKIRRFEIKIGHPRE